MSAENCERVVTKDFVFGTVCDSVSFLWNNLNCHFQELRKGVVQRFTKKYAQGQENYCTLVGYIMFQRKTSLLVFRAKALLILSSGKQSATLI